MNDYYTIRDVDRKIYPYAKVCFSYEEAQTSAQIVAQKHNVDVVIEYHYRQYREHHTNRNVEKITTIYSPDSLQEFENAPWVKNPDVNVELKEEKQERMRSVLRELK